MRILAITSLLWYDTGILPSPFVCSGYTIVDLNFDPFPCPFLQNQGPFGDSIAAWEEAADIKQRQNQKTVYQDISTLDETLIVKTHDLICSDHETHGSSRLSSHSVNSLKNTIHLKALSTALQMARSHHVVAVEAVMTRKEERIAPSKENLDHFRVAVNHHLHALKLIFEIRRLRAASNKSSLDGRKFASRFKGAAKKVITTNRIIPGGGRLTTHGRDIGVVSGDRTTNI